MEESIKLPETNPDEEVTMKKFPFTNEDELYGTVDESKCIQLLIILDNPNATKKAMSKTIGSLLANNKIVTKGWVISLFYCCYS